MNRLQELKKKREYLKNRLLILEALAEDAFDYCLIEISDEWDRRIFDTRHRLANVNYLISKYGK